MGERYRSTDEQRIDMLLLLKKEDQLQTALMHGCNLNHPRVTAHLQHLVERCAVVWNERTEKYCLLPLGEEAIRRYNAFKELI